MKNPRWSPLPYASLAVGITTCALTLIQTRAAVPTITGFEPKVAVAGSTVTIHGGNFSPQASENTIYFGAVRATVTAATGTGLQVKVPSGATFAPISVTVNGLSADSPQPFLPTFPGNGSPIGPGTLAPAFTMSAPLGPTPIAFADLDNDGKPDLVVGNSRARSIWLLRNISTSGSLSSASFEPPIEIPFPPADSYKITVADVDGDGKLDLIVAGIGVAQISIFRNTTAPGPGAAISLAARVDIQVGADCRFARAADLDGDGKLDLVAANYGDNTISILKNIGSPGTLTADSFAPRVDLPAPTGPYKLAIGDLDHDGKPDIAVATYGQLLAVYRNTSAAGILDANSFARVDFPSPVEADTIELGDIDGDGNLDIVIGSIRPLNIAVYRNLGVSPFAANSLADRVEFPTGHWTHDVALADFDGDGKPDIAADGELESYVSIFQNLSSPGDFTASSLGSRVDYSTGWNAWGLAVGDLDGDGRPDVALANHWDSTFTVYQNVSPFGGPPLILQQPADLAVVLGESAAFTVHAEGSPQLSYQWWHGDVALAGATNSTLTLSETLEVDAGTYFVTVTNSLGSATSSVARLTFTDLPPYITSQPKKQTVMLGGTAEFSVTAGGTRPLSFQWRLNGTNLAGATASALTLANVRRDQAGDYSVEITNTLGSITSLNALLTVIVPPSEISVVNTTNTSGWPVTVPIRLNASGEENALSFSLVFGGYQRGSLLGFVSAAAAAAGPALGGAALVVNTNQLPYGRVGIAIALPAGAKFPRGTQDVALVTFDAVVVTQATPVLQTLYFADQPLPRQVADPLAISLPATFTVGTVTLLPSDLEGDTTPRPGGNRLLTINDWVQAGRFVAGLDVPASESEFQRADCAPRATRGDGHLKVTDWVQAGRYFARVDPLTAVSGPTSPLPPAPVAKGFGREVRVLNATAVQGLEVVVPVELQAQGDENALGLTLTFDPARLQFSSATLGAGAAGAVLNVNSLEAASGALGLALALPTGAVFPAGQRQIVSVIFAAKPAATGPIPIAFADAPVFRAVSDAAANELAADYITGTVTVNPPPSLSINLSGNQILLSWPAWASDFGLQTSVDGMAGWVNLPAAPQTNGSALVVAQPIADQNTFFRLQH
ncbi:MAG TPA: FG-GAP-like repeat-containing protein [Verrucomicrobiae bacterium]